MKTTTNNKDHQNSKSRQVGGGGANDLSINNTSAKNKAKVLLPPPSSAVSRSKHNSGSAKNDNSNKPNPILTSNNPNNNLSSNSSRFLQFVGTSCGHHASYTFYKAIKYMKNGQTHILGLGEFFFVKIWPNSDLVAIGELQLLWEDRNTNQILSSTRLYFLPEYTPEGRTHHHGEVRKRFTTFYLICTKSCISLSCIQHYILLFINSQKGFISLFIELRFIRKRQFCYF